MLDLIKISEKFKISLEESFFAIIIKKQDQNLASLFVSYINNRFPEESKLKYYIHNLEDKGVIINMAPPSRRGSNTMLYDLMPTPRFKEMFFDSEKAVEELIQVFPKKVVVDGNTFPSVNMSSEDIEREYNKIHMGDFVEHQRIIRITKNYSKKTNGVSVCSIGKYLQGRYFDIIEEEGDNTDSFRTSNI